MNGFQKIILFSASIILIITFISIGLAIHNSRSISWPPLVPSCPDYWLIDGAGNNTKCINVRNLGTCQPNSSNKHLIMDFNGAPYVGSNGNCAKYTWANNCNLAWDGINYGVSNPCNSQQPSNSTTNSSNFFDWFTTKKNNYN